ncbi:MAG: hypothetical protein EKK48_22140 [Candidatus Melainabacteria bacterium]|nr:MAG: hypothetical protein EKK48_22140 [Candidatus Melainabacteria bacterium]
MRMDATSEQQAESSARRIDHSALISLSDFQQAHVKSSGTTKEPEKFLDLGKSSDLYKLDDPLADFHKTPTHRLTSDTEAHQHKFLFGGNAHGTLDSLESAIGGKANLEMFPVKPGNREQMDHIRTDLAKGVTPEISLNGEFFRGGDKAIATGRYDKQLTQMAHELSQMKNPDGTKAEILMRFGKEMDLQHKFVGTGQDYVNAFQRVHDVFQNAGADNVKMVWCPTKKVDPSELANEANPDKYWPGSKYVDVIGPDGYSPKHKEESFQKIFEPFVDLAKRTGKPFMSSETGIHTDGMTEKQKSDWWQKAFDYVKNERDKGTDIMGVGGFFRHPETNETLSDNQRKVLSHTFIKAEGTTGSGGDAVRPPHEPPHSDHHGHDPDHHGHPPDHPGHHPPTDHEPPGHDRPHHCHPHHPGHKPPTDGPIPPDQGHRPPIDGPLPPDHSPIPPVIDPIYHPPPDHIPVPPVVDPIDPPPPPPGSNPPADILFGGYTSGSWRGNEARDALDREIGGKAELEQFYRPMGGSITDLKNYIQGDLDRGILPEVSLNPRKNDFNYTDIASGKHDQYFRDLATQLGNMKDAKGNPAEILMRPGWEFNLRWMKNMGTSEQYVAAFQHMHDIFQQEGANNVKFVWSPGSKLDMSGLGSEPDLQHYWPGAKYVDVVGPDGYCNRDQSFEQIFNPAMDLAQRIGKSFMVSETGVNREAMTEEQTADWWRSAFETLQRRQAAGLDVTGVAAFMKAGDFGWGYFDYNISKGAEQDTLRDTFLQ